VAQPAAGGAYESDAPGSEPLPTAALADATRVRVTAGSDAATWGAAQSAALVALSAGPAANAAMPAAGASIEARNRPALRDDARSTGLVSVTSGQGVTQRSEPDPATPGPLVRTLIAALSEGDSTMIAPPPVPETEQPANARQVDLEVRPAGSAPAAVAPSAADADAHVSLPQDLPATRDRQSPEVLQRGDLLEERLQVTENWLNRIDPKHYTIQLLATVAGERNSLLQFLDRQRQRNGLQDVYVYETYIGGRSWYSVVFGNFSSYSEARDALRGLPRDLARHSPFIRNLSDLRSRS